MTRTRALEALITSYQDFDFGSLRKNFDNAKSDQLVKRPVERYSYALVRAALNVFAQHNFADHLNTLAFDRDNFHDTVRAYVPQVWPYYLEEAQDSLGTALIRQINPLEFRDWLPGGRTRFGAWHRLNFHEFQVDVLIQISNKNARLGAFEGLCYLENDQNRDYAMPDNQVESCHHLGSMHLQTVADEILDSLGIAPESAISAIKQSGRSQHSLLLAG
jgi:hypothetical protein